MRSLPSLPFLVAAGALALAACSNPAPATVAQATRTPADASLIEAALASAERPDTDVARDENRKPGEVLAFAAVAPGDVVVDLGASAGYYTRLFSQIVGETGVVAMQNPPVWVDQFNLQPGLDAIAAAHPNIEIVNEDFDKVTRAPGTVDLAAMILIYHDTGWLPVDRAAMNRNIYAMVKPGGAFLVIDHRAEDGAGVRDVKSLHRIDEATVKAEITAAGFTLEKTSDILAHPDDPRTASVFDKDRRGETDRFVHLYRKPVE